MLHLLIHQQVGSFSSFARIQDRPVAILSDGDEAHADDVEQLIAVGVDDGSVRLFKAQAGVSGLQYARTMPRVEGRVLSAAWHPSGQILVTGTSAGTVHVWDVSSAQEVRRIVIGALLAGDQEHSWNSSCDGVCIALRNVVCKCALVSLQSSQACCMIFRQPMDSWSA